MSAALSFTPLEPPLDPDVPIIDPHHHLWGASASVLAGRRLTDPGLGAFDRITLSAPRYLLDEFLTDVGAGHNVRATVFVQAHAMYNIDGPAWSAPLGETEFANGIAAMSASGIYGDVRINAGIVGFADLFLGSRIQDLLEAHIRAGNGRFRGIRQSGAWDADDAVLGGLTGRPAAIYRDARFREGFARLAPLGLSFDAWVLEPQLGDVVDLAKAFPATQIVINHLGTPLGVGTYAGKQAERFPIWRTQIAELSELPNVSMKLGGLGMPFSAFEGSLATPRHSSAQLADQWRPYVETAIEHFGAIRCMFESNFPVEIAAADYVTLWNAFKRLASGAGKDERAALFAGTAKRVYRLDSICIDSS